jgi:Flp pilus assembly protein TadG
MTFHVLASQNRRAAVVPMAALFMIFLVGMLAFSIDIGYICSVQAELQDAADAAALAGAQQLQDLFVQYYFPGQTQQQQIYLQATTNVNAYDPSLGNPVLMAQRFAAYNQAGGVYVQVPVTDISFSYYDGTTFSSPSYANNLFPNTVTVTTRRDNTANGPLGLFFGKIFGVSTINLTAVASATIYAGDVTSLQVIPGVNAHVLPVALDVNVWSNFARGNLSSPWVLGSITTGPNGLPQLQVYPFGTNTPGSFGLIDVGVPSNNTPAFRNWIDDGSTPNDISYLLNNNLLPVSMSAPAQWKCGPGLKSTLVSNFQSVIGESNLIPLFYPVSPAPNSPSPGPNYVAASGSGQNATYAVVGFAGVTVSSAGGNGNNMNISIQPAAIVDPTAVIPNVLPAGVGQSSVSGTLQTTFVSAKLTQ